ncbi:3-deoxy-D-manno-octulosonic acid transferase [bacterium]|nr:3-deoxy-D-manno-octulosonic acid transferase [bacterium]
MFLYEIVVTILFIIALPIYAVIRAIQKKYMFGWKEKMGFLKVPDNLKEKRIMFHGVSVGEIIALENLIKRTKDEFPDYSIIVTTGTKTGQDIAHKKYKGVADYITYFPYDVPSFVRSFLKKVKPSFVYIAETELWPAFSHYCRQYKIPLFIINGRISDSTYKTYLNFRFFFKKMLLNYTGIYTQSNEDNDKLITLGANPDTTKVMGNLKFDVKPKVCDIEIGQNEGRVIIAGSTHTGEDEIVLEAFKQVKSQVPDVKLLLAPRHPQRVPQIEELVKNTGLDYGLRSQNDTFNDKDIILLDTLGELGKAYALCHFAFIGGSFNTTGGHNPLEASVYDKPVISGPDVHNFKDIFGLLTKTNAGKIVKNEKELTEHMTKLLTNEDFYKSACDDCKKVFESQKGALEFVIEKIREATK